MHHSDAAGAARRKLLERRGRRGTFQWVVDYERGDGEVPPQFGGRARLPKCVEGAQSVRIILAA